MLYLLAILFPPAAVLLSGKPLEAIFNVLLTLCFWVPGVIHAMLMVSSHQADQRSGRMVGALRKQEQATTRARKALEKSERAKAAAAR